MQLWTSDCENMILVRNGINDTAVSCTHGTGGHCFWFVWY